MPDKLKILFKKLYNDSQLPMRKNDEDAGFDCFIHHFVVWDESENKMVKIKSETYPLLPKHTIGCALGFASAIPNGYYAHVLPRSGLALKQSIMTVIGTIDAGYRNEWIGIVNNLGNEVVNIKIGDRICQMIIRKMEDIEVVCVDNLPDSMRGMNGLGSSGK